MHFHELKSQKTRPRPRSRKPVVFAFLSHRVRHMTPLAVCVVQARKKAARIVPFAVTDSKHAQAIANGFVSYLCQIMKRGQ